MELQELSQLMHKFVSDKGWYEANSPRPQTSRNIAISLCLEAAEVLEHVQWSEDVADVESLEGELADVMLYLMQLASINGIDLEASVLKKLKVNYMRTWK